MILRAAENFGPCELVLVAPERPALLLHPEFEQMSHGVEDIDEKVRVVDTMQDALAECTASVGFTARVRDNLVRASFGELLGELTASAADPEERLALVFGNERTGLTAEEAGLCQQLVHVRTAEAHTSLNLAICVGIVLQALFVEEQPRVREPGGHPITGAEREFLKAHLAHALATFVARSDSAAREIRDSVERVFSRAPVETRDARAFHLMARALGSDRTPADFGLTADPPERPRRGGA
jgi:tRNA C32,U32 (ribose-2'-O)-methylase TrmJ